MMVESEYLLNFIDVPKTERIRYFNSGVILFNLKKIRQDNKAKELFVFMKENQNKIQMPDQDALNVVFYKQVTYLDSKKYNNLMFTRVKVDWKKKKELENDACIIHYVGADKPWFYKYLNSSFKYYWKIERENGNKKEYVTFLLKHYLYLIVKKIYVKIRKRDLYD
jgi:lipopolysaccharide biosynthesis glycosyltransferase